METEGPEKISLRMLRTELEENDEVFLKLKMKFAGIRGFRKRIFLA